MNSIRASLLQVPGVRHSFFTREGGVSSGIYASLNGGTNWLKLSGPGSRDDANLVAENRQIAAASLGVSAARLCTADQIHSSTVVFVTQPWHPSERPRADAMVTRETSIALGVLTADCAPILLVEPMARVIGAVHAGWRGALAGIAGQTVRAMTKLGAEPPRILAAVGPAIGQPSYEVGIDLHQAFLKKDPGYDVYFESGTREMHFQFDLPGFLVDQLNTAGVRRIAVTGHDTYAAPERFFSHRYNQHQQVEDYGRHLSAILLEG